MPRSLRTLFPLMMVAIALLATRTHAECCGGGLLDRATLERLGLHRAWFSQVQLDKSYSVVNDWALDYDQLFISTDIGVIQAFDVNTGRTLWTTRIGEHDYPTLGPTVSERYVAAINGSTAYLLNRQNGRVAHEQPLDGAPGAPPLFANNYLFVPLINGRVVGYEITEGTATFPWHYQSFGRATVTPLAMPDGMMWATDRGYLYASGGEQPAIRYRVETPAEFAAAPKLTSDAIYASSSSGELFALNPTEGSLRWKYATGFSAYRAPAVVGNEIYFSTVEPSLHCIDAASGEAKWFAHGVGQFVAATKGHIYALDPYGALYVLNRQGGGRLASAMTDTDMNAVSNDQSDRLILITPTGLVQCLHELGAAKPQYHIARPGAADDAAVDEAAGDEAAAGEIEADDEPTPVEAVDEVEADFMDEDADDDFGDFGAPADAEADDIEDDDADVDPFDMGDDENPFF